MKPLQITAAGGLVRNEKGELLMIFRRGFWDLPKGKLDEGETIEECALREVKEETGLQNIEPGDFLGTTAHTYFDDRFTHQNVVKTTHWFSMRVAGKPELKPQTEEDIEKAEWCNAEKVKQHSHNTYENIREILKKYFTLQDYN